MWQPLGEALQLFAQSLPQQRFLLGRIVGGVRGVVLELTVQLPGQPRGADAGPFIGRVGPVLGQAAQAIGYRLRPRQQASLQKSWFCITLLYKLLVYKIF